MAGRDHIVIAKDPAGKFRARIHYANGRRGEGSEQGFTRVDYLIERTSREHPGVPIHVLYDSHDYWVDVGESVA